MNSVPITMAARSKAWVCGSSLAGIAGSNPVGSMDVCLLCLLCVVSQTQLRRADHASREALKNVGCFCVIVQPR
jgi:hypothetical protein